MSKLIEVNKWQREKIFLENFRELEVKKSKEEREAELA